MSNLHDVVVDDDYSTYIVNKSDHVTRVHGDAAIEVTSYALAMEIAGSVDGGDKAGLLATTKPADYIPSPADEANGDQGYYEYGYSTVIVDHGATISGSIGISATVAADDRDSTNAVGGQNDVELHNHGTITGTEGAALVSDDRSYFYVVDNQSDGIINGIDAKVEVLNNAGLIDGGTRSAIDRTIEYDSFNTGTITAAGDRSTIAIDVSLDNSGTVSATGAGVAFMGGTLVNEKGGVVSAAHGAAIDASNSTIDLVNAGEIKGSVIAGGISLLGSVVDQSGGGTIRGDVRFGDGDDRFVGMIDAKGHVTSGVTGTIDGGNGRDTFAVNATKDVAIVSSDVPKNFEAFQIDAMSGVTATLKDAHALPLVIGGDGTVVFDGALTSAGTSVHGAYDEYATTSFENDGVIKSTGTGEQSGQAFDFYDPEPDTDGDAHLASFVNKGTIEAAGEAVRIDSAPVPNFMFDNELNIISHSGTAVDLTLFGADTDVISNSGKIAALDGTALSVAPQYDDYEIALNSKHAAVANSGTLSGDTGASIAGADFDNSGTIMSNDGVGVEMLGGFTPHDHMVNTGSITGDLIGVILSEASLTNGGTIASIEPDGSAIAIENGGTVTITHDGKVDGATGISDYTGQQGSSIIVHNDGSIRGGIHFGDAYSYGSLQDGDHVINTGSIVGAISLAGDNDVLDSRLGTTNGLVSGNGGDDLIRGGDNHTLADGGTGDDRIYGDGGDDRLSGGDGNDHVYGGIGNDRVDGGAGSDILSGGDGDDVIIGGQGQDQLYGGAGNDNFVFQTASDSPAAGWVSGDRIEDWHSGDTIDLHQIDAIDPQHANGADHAFAFVGMNAFDGGTGEVRFAYAGANTIVYADLDGDRHADFGFALKGHVDLHATDFVL